MKFTIAMLSLVLSANVFAYSVTNAVRGTINLGISSTSSPFLTSTGVSVAQQKVQAEAVINDAQDMLQTGEVSLFLSQKIQETQALNDDLSEGEALDMIIDSAQAILSK